MSYKTSEEHHDERDEFNKPYDFKVAAFYPKASKKKPQLIQGSLDLDSLDRVEEAALHVLKNAIRSLHIDETTEITFQMRPSKLKSTALKTR